MNLCIECKYIGTNASGDWEKYRCFAPENEAGKNLVTGSLEYKVILCKDVRYPAPDDVVVNCVSFEAKPPAPLVQSQQDSISNFKAKLSAKKSIGLNDL